MRNTNNTYKTQGGDNLVITVRRTLPCSNISSIT